MTQLQDVKYEPNNLPELDNKLATKIEADFMGAMASFFLVIGDQLGLFKAVRDSGPTTSAALATTTGLQIRYVDQWLRGAYAAEYIDYQPQTQKYSMNATTITLLADEGGPYFLPGLFQQMFPLWLVIDKVMKAFKQGGGVDYKYYDYRFWEGLERESIVAFRHTLVQSWLPTIPDVQKRLQQGINVLDIGCGRGRASIEMAKAFPNSHFTGYDIHKESILAAREYAEKEDVADRVQFEVIDIGQDIPGKFDFITAFDVIHDLANPQQAFVKLATALRPGGSIFIREFLYDPTIENNRGPFPTALHAFSLMYCMTTALEHGTNALGTTGLHLQVLEKLATTAGLSSPKVAFTDEEAGNIAYIISKDM